ncbi:hypothetical protein, variant 1 [Verruconis gallopava]|uniref:SGNH hydrolase-type esterase domain-containing protein n=1 Tax=Verruconis gallopava TaxID=253628 RepID=A0A0D2A2H8_9PEZI|nr:hypothetical protein, variant 1 [Verruconis gallopava]KIW00958.1 hypothetical protein, variant 1 [Verruconis gallopava]
MDEGGQGHSEGPITSSSSTGKLRPRSPTAVSILAFGDSLTEGYTDFGVRFHSYGLALKPALQKLCPGLKRVTVDVEGQSGDCVLTSLRGEFQTRLQHAAPAGKTKYDLVIILGGTNDLAYKLDRGLEGAEEIFEHGLKVLYDYVLGSTDASLLVMTVPERAIDKQSSPLAKRAREAREHLNSLIKRWAAEQKERVFLMDLAPMVPFPASNNDDDDGQPGKGYWSPDGLHMSVAGYDFVGEQLAGVIHKLLSD